MQKEVHFHSSDTRFCGSEAIGRRFTLDPDKVTCQGCKDRDTFVLSPSGVKLLTELGFVDEQGKIH